MPSPSRMVTIWLALTFVKRSTFCVVGHLISILDRLGPGTTELCCHPGDDEELDTMYWRGRAQEVKTLCDPRARAAVGDENPLDRLPIADVDMPFTIIRNA